MDGDKLFSSFDSSLRFVFVGYFTALNVVKNYVQLKQGTLVSFVTGATLLLVSPLAAELALVVRIVTRFSVSKDEVNPMHQLFLFIQELSHTYMMM